MQWLWPSEWAIRFSNYWKGNGKTTPPINENPNVIFRTARGDVVPENTTELDDLVRKLITESTIAKRQKAYLLKIFHLSEDTSEPESASDSETPPSAEKMEQVREERNTKVIRFYESVTKHNHPVRYTDEIHSIYLYTDPAKDEHNKCEFELLAGWLLGNWSTVYKTNANTKKMASATKQVHIRDDNAYVVTIGLCCVTDIMAGKTDVTFYADNGPKIAEKSADTKEQTE